MSHEHTKLRYNRIPFHTPEGEQILQRVERHWEKMRKMGPVPAQLSLSPEPLDNALSHCFVLERVGATIARFRVAGQALTHLMGMEARAMPLSALFSAEGREALGPLVNSCCEGPEIVEIPLIASRGLGRSSMRGRLLMLPLKDRDGDVTRLFGCIVSDTPPGRRVMRFDIDRQIPIRCKRLTPLMETLTELRDRFAFPADEDRQPERIPAVMTKIAQTPHLRLVVDNT